MVARNTEFVRELGSKDDAGRSSEGDKTWANDEEAHDVDAEVDRDAAAVLGRAFGRSPDVELSGRQSHRLVRARSCLDLGPISRSALVLNVLYGHPLSMAPQ